MSDAIIALIRTVVPALVGGLAAWFLTLGIDLPEDVAAALVLGLTGTITGIYYALARFLSTKWPAFGWLLGYPATPEYRGRHAAG